MALQWPKTIRGWVELVLAVGTLIAALAGGAWQYHVNNAYASDVIESKQEVRQEVLQKIEEVEQYAAQGIKSATCNQIRTTIRRLRREKENDPDNWTGSDESYLQDMLLQWQQYCTNNEG